MILCMNEIYHDEFFRKKLSSIIRVIVYIILFFSTHEIVRYSEFSLFDLFLFTYCWISRSNTFSFYFPTLQDMKWEGLKQ